MSNQTAPINQALEQLDSATAEVVPETGKYPIREIFSKFHKDFLAAYGDQLTDEQKTVLGLIGECKKGERLGYNMAYCPKCNHYLIHNNSCNNRNCPSCQVPLERKWIEERAAEVIPDIAYFHIVCTSPDVLLVPLFWANMEKLIAAYMNAATSSVVNLAESQKHGGFTPAVIAVVHTMGSQMQRHPHVHMIVSGGGLDMCRQFIQAPHDHFFVPTEVLGICFRSTFLSKLQALYDNHELVIPPELSHLEDPLEWKNYIDKLYHTQWNCFIKETFNGHGNAIRYLARYVYRTAISNSRIVSVNDEDKTVTFKYIDHKDKDQWKIKTVTAVEFIRRFLDHVLPKGVHRVVYAGLLANAFKKKNLKHIYMLRNRIYGVSALHGKKMADVMRILFKRDICHCPKCGSELLTIRWMDQGSSTIALHFRKKGNVFLDQIAQADKKEVESVS